MLRAELRAAWTRRLGAWWRLYNHEYVGDAMRPPSIELGSACTQLGRWQRESRRLLISVAHIETSPWVEVLATLRHEMAHQFADEVLHADDEPPHGSAFQRACERLRCLDCDADAGADGRDAAAERVLARVHKVLTLTASPNQHEAAAAVKHARRLLLRHNLDASRLEQQAPFVRRHLGPVKARHAAYELWLSQILQEFFFTEVIWVASYRPLEDRDGTVLEVCGTRPDVEMAAYVYAYLTQLVERLWERYRRARKLRSNRERQRFYAGVLQGFCSKLHEQERHMQVDEALVWQADGRLQEFHRYLYPRVNRRRGGSVKVTAAYQDGVVEGRNVTVHRPVPGGGAGFGGYLGGA